MVGRKRGLASRWAPSIGVCVLIRQRFIRLVLFRIFLQYCSTNYWCGRDEPSVGSECGRFDTTMRCLTWWWAVGRLKWWDGVMVCKYCADGGGVSIFSGSKRERVARLADSLIAVHTLIYRFGIKGVCRSVDAPKGRCVVCCRALLGQAQFKSFVCVHVIKLHNTRQS